MSVISGMDVENAIRTHDLDSAKGETVASDETVAKMFRRNIQPLPPGVLNPVSLCGEKRIRHGQKSRGGCDGNKRMVNDEAFSLSFIPAKL